MTDRGVSSPVVVRLNGPRLAALALALLLLLALAVWAGFRLGRSSSGATIRPIAGGAGEDAAMTEGSLTEDRGFASTVTLRSGYALLVFRSDSLSRAEAVRSELADRGLPVRLDQDPRRPRADRFRVLVGPFGQRAEAAAARGRLSPWEPPAEPEVVWLE